MTQKEGVEVSQPSLISKTDELVSVMQKLSSREISQLMGISANLADLNKDRFGRFDPMICLWLKSNEHEIPKISIRP